MANVHIRGDLESFARNLEKQEALASGRGWSEIYVSRETITRWDRKRMRREERALHRSIRELGIS